MTIFLHAGKHRNLFGTAKNDAGSPSLGFGPMTVTVADPSLVDLVMTPSPVITGLALGDTTVTFTQLAFDGGPTITGTATVSVQPAPPTHIDITADPEY